MYKNERYKTIQDFYNHYDLDNSRYYRKELSLAKTE